MDKEIENMIANKRISPFTSSGGLKVGSVLSKSTNGRPLSGHYNTRPDSNSPENMQHQISYFKNPKLQSSLGGSSTCNDYTTPSPFRKSNRSEDEINSCVVVLRSGSKGQEFFRAVVRFYPEVFLPEGTGPEFHFFVQL